jgi:hypothetical protein
MTATADTGGGSALNLAVSSQMGLARCMVRAGRGLAVEDFMMVAVVVASGGGLRR